MPRRSILSATERDSLLAPPDAKDELIRLFTFNDADLSRIRQHRGAANRLGFAVQLCYMRYPGIALTADAEPEAPLLRLVADQLKLPGDIWNDYGQRAETRREHLLELQSAYGFQSFTTLSHYRAAVHSLDDLAWQTDKGIVLARELAEGLRRKSVLLPALGVMVGFRQRVPLKLHSLRSLALASAAARRLAKRASTSSCGRPGRGSSRAAWTFARNQASCAAGSEAKSNGNVPSLATRVSRMRTASEMVRPM